MGAVPAPFICGAALVPVSSEPDLSLQGLRAPSPKGFLSFVLRVMPGRYEAGGFPPSLLTS